MKSLIQVILFSSAVAFIKAQDLSLTKFVDKNLKVLFPSVIDSFENGNTEYYNSKSGIVEFSVSIQLSPVADRSKEEFDNSLKTFKKSIDSFSRTLYFTKLYCDTIIGGTKGIYVILHSPDREMSIKKLHIFYTTKDSFAYTFYAKLYGPSDEKIKQEINKFYSGIKFNENYYNTLPGTLYDIPSRKIPGRIFGIVATFIILSYLVYSMAKGKTVV
ncbi:MAG: hypothetical protein ABI675_00415 [Chitinophagaceae bacterium]